MLHFFLIGVSALIFRRFQPDLFGSKLRANLHPLIRSSGIKDQEYRRLRLVMKSGGPIYLVLAQREPTSKLRPTGEFLLRLGARTYDGLQLLHDPPRKERILVGPPDVR